MNNETINISISLLIVNVCINASHLSDNRILDITDKLIHILDTANDDIKLYCLYSIYALSQLKDSVVCKVTSIGLKLMNMFNDNIRMNIFILRYIGNSICLPDDYAEYYINHGLLDKLVQLWDMIEDDKIKKEIMWILSNITACNDKEIIMKVVETKLLQAACDGVHNDLYEEKTLYEMRYVLANVCYSNSENVICYLIQHNANIIANLVEIIKHEEGNANNEKKASLLSIALKGFINICTFCNKYSFDLSNILPLLNITDTLEQLQTSKVQNVSIRSTHLLSFFPHDTVDDL